MAVQRYTLALIGALAWSCAPSAEFASSGADTPRATSREPVEFTPADYEEAERAQAAVRQAEAEDAVDEWVAAHPEDESMRDELLAEEVEIRLVEDLREDVHSERYGFDSRGRVAR